MEKKKILMVCLGNICRSPLAEGVLKAKVNANEVFSFGRDHGHFGRILNQAVVSLPSLHLSKDKHVTGFCFTPQDGNSLLSSISIAEWFMYPKSYEEKIQCLKPFFFDEV